MSISEELNQVGFGYAVYNNKKVIANGIIYDGRRTIKSVINFLNKKYPDSKCIVQKATCRYYMTHTTDALCQEALNQIKKAN